MSEFRILDEVSSKLRQSHDAAREVKVKNETGHVEKRQKAPNS